VGDGSQPSKHADDVLADGVAFVVYGTITVLAVLGGLRLESQSLKALQAAAVLVVAALASWLAHSMWRVITARARQDPEPERSHELHEVLRSWPIVASGLPGAASMVLAAVGIWSVATGLQVAISRHQAPTHSDDWHEDVNNVVAAVVLERRSCAVSIRPLREAPRGRADLLVDARRLTVQADAGVPPTRERAALRPDRRRVVAGARHRANAVGSRHGIECPVELSPAQPDRGLERGPGPLDLRQLVNDADEHHLQRLAHHDVFVAHARKLQPSGEEQPRPRRAMRTRSSAGRLSA